MRDHIHFRASSASCSPHLPTPLLDCFPHSTVLKMLTRSSVLGKRGHHNSSPAAPTVQACEHLQTPDSTPNPKRARTSTSVEDGDGNKENIPPYKFGPLNTPSTPRSARAMRRYATFTDIASPTRIRSGIPTQLLLDQYFLIFPLEPRRTASASSLVPTTPSAEKSDVALLTPPPTPPKVLLPLHVRIRALLRSTCNSEIGIAGRETERASIFDFITSFVEDTAVSEVACSSLFISGSPGTGKTALVNAIIRGMSTANDTVVKVVSINCMTLNNIDALWEKMVEELAVGSNQKSTVGKKPKGRDMVKSLLNSLQIKW